MKYYIEPATMSFHIHKQESKDPGMFAQAHMHTYVEMLYCISGEFLVCQNEKPYRLLPGDLAIITTDTIHSVQALSKNQNSYHVIKFNPTLLYSIGQTESDMHFLQPLTLQDTNVKKMFGKDELSQTEIPGILNMIINENNNREVGFEFAIKGLFEQLAVILVRYWKTHCEFNRLLGISSVTLERCRGVLPVLWEQYQNPPSATEMAAKCYMSYSGFANVFRQLTGYSYLGYIHFIRIIKAKELLLTTKMSVTEIGQAIGFSTSSYFIEQFTKSQHISPGQYRKQAKNN